VVKKIARQVARGLLIALLTLALFELCALIYVKAALHRSPGSLRDEYRAALATHNTRRTGQSLFARADPLFGYVSGRFYANNFGFESRKRFPYAKQPGEFVVGIFGGSVAGQLGLFLEDHQDASGAALQARLPAVAGKVVFVNFGMGGYRQPQASRVFATFADTVDLAINVDGFNEMYFVTPAHFIEYPGFTDALSGSAVQREREEELKRVHDRRGYFLELPERSLLGWSSGYYVVWRWLDGRLQRRAQELSNALFGGDWPGKPYYTQSPAQVRELGAKNWAKYTRLQWASAKALQKRSFYFLQPNQHLGLKPLSASEAQLIEGSTVYKSDAIREGYRYLQAELVDLRRRGVPVFDLTPAFAGQGDTLYVDDCCHLGARGHELLWQRMIEVMAREWVTAEPRQ
jgi:hypothetical protein